MNTSAELTPKLLGKISEDFVKVADFLKDASYEMRRKNFSQYPVFIATNNPFKKELLLADKEMFGNQKCYFASYLEIFEHSSLGKNEEFSSFKENFKNPDEYCCLFYEDVDFSAFVFLPYPEDNGF